MSEKTYDYFETNNKGKYKATAASSPGIKLIPGIYQVVPTMSGLVYQSAKNTHDSIIELPSPEYKYAVKRLQHFISTECKTAMKELDYIYKQSMLLYGQPGTGKTIIVNKIAEEVVKLGGVVLFDPDPDYLGEVLKQLDDIQPETMICVILEELDSWLEEGAEDTLLNLLDGESQKDNILYLCTTNYIDKIPTRS